MVYLTKDAQLKGLPNGIQKNDIHECTWNRWIHKYIKIVVNWYLIHQKMKKKNHWTYGLFYPIGAVTQNVLLKKRWIPSYLHIKLEKGSLNILSIRTTSYPYLIYIWLNIYYIDKILALLIDRNFVRNLYQ